MGFLLWAWGWLRLLRPGHGSSGPLRGPDAPVDSDRGRGPVCPVAVAAPVAPVSQADCRLGADIVAYRQRGSSSRSRGGVGVVDILPDPRDVGSKISLAVKSPLLQRALAAVGVVAVMASWVIVRVAWSGRSARARVEALLSEALGATGARGRACACSPGRGRVSPLDLDARHARSPPGGALLGRRRSTWTPTSRASGADSSAGLSSSPPISASRWRCRRRRRAAAASSSLGTGGRTLRQHRERPRHGRSCCGSATTRGRARPSKRRRRRRHGPSRTRGNLSHVAGPARHAAPRSPRPLPQCERLDRVNGRWPARPTSNT